ncbi:MAG: beta-galactosidase [Acidobacteriota bacterium]|nr:beta-galactosidase [Acidobacteriota bacterium]
MWPSRPPGIAYGGDFNPEQWPEETLDEDLRLMAEAGVSFVSLAIFSWALLEPEPGRYEFAWLDRVIDAMAGAGIAVDLATATASPPPWWSRAHPDSLPVLADGTTLWWGSRQAFCPSSPDYRRSATALAAALAEHYRNHPALSMWHVHNEYGCHNAACYCDTSAASFRVWLRSRYDDLDRLNHAWGTTFWSQRYGEWDEILPPRSTGTWRNPGQQLDWARFCSDELLACYRAEREVLRRVTPDVPVTTNFMSLFEPLDYRAWAAEVDVVSNDHYVRLDMVDPADDLSLAGDLMRSLAGGPWWLMEHSTSAVNWQPLNRAKAPGEMIRNSLTHVARGADAIGFFQWRASRAGAEKYHSGMVPHAGTDTKVWREVVQLGAHLRALAEVAGSSVDAEVALAWTWPAWWGAELGAHPSVHLDAAGHLRAWHAALRRRAVTADVVSPLDGLAPYRLVVAPHLYLLTDEEAAALTAYVEGGGTLLATFFSGIVDERDHIRLGGYPGALRDLLGVRMEEFFPLLPGETVGLSDGRTGRIWSELGRTEGAEVRATFASGPVAGSPALTRHAVGAGHAWYLATRLDGADLDALVGDLVARCGVRRTAEVAEGVEVVRRRGPDGTWLFAINHTAEEQAVAASGLELLTGRPVDGRVTVAPGAVAVVRERGGG